jgi:prepilin-type N-terminal cleavage/methylation domain-containing protein
MQSTISQHFRRAFSLTEILMVVAIIGVLAAVSIPAYRGVMQATWNSESEDFVETLNKAVRNFNQANWDIPTAANNSATTDEFLVLRSLQYKWPISSLKPGSPYFPANYNPTASSDANSYRVRWNGKTFEVLRPGTAGSGFLRTFTGAEYTTAYTHPNGYKPEGMK